MLTEQAFFARIDTALRKADSRFTPHKPGTNTGMNVYQSPRRGRYVTLTVNYVQGEQASVKLTIQRDTPGGPTRVFDAVNARYKTDEDKLDGDVSWTWDSRKSSKKESRVIAETRARSWPRAKYEAWVVKNALVLLEWAVFSDSL